MEREIVNRTEEENMLRPVCLDGETPCSNGKECEACTFFKQSQPLIAFPNERCLLCERALATRTWAMTVSRGDYATGPFAHANYANRVSWLFDYPPAYHVAFDFTSRNTRYGFFSFHRTIPTHARLFVTNRSRRKWVCHPTTHSRKYP